MVCYHPIKAFIVDESKQFQPVERKYIWTETDREYIIYNHQRIDKFIYIPCNKCIGCRIDRSREWANRMTLELQYHSCACFITLTYNDDYAPKGWTVDDNGEMHENAKLLTLRKEHFQKFMKRLRRHVEPAKIRFFACGEYGTHTHRPHYHAIIFGYDFPDKIPFNHDDKGNVNYRSPTLEKIWTDPKTHESYGYSLVSEVNWNTCAYVARYCVKKYEPIHNIYYQTSDGEIIYREPEFNLMSRRPGIGRQYYDEHKEEVYVNQEIFISNANGGMKIQPPKYYDRLYTVDNPEHMEEIKAHREEVAKAELEAKLRQTNLTLGQLLRTEERTFRERISRLERNKI